MPILSIDPPKTKQCAYCLQNKPLSEFRRRTGKRSKTESRRGACRECRKSREAGTAPIAAFGLGQVVSSETPAVPAQALPPTGGAPAAMLDTAAANAPVKTRPSVRKRKRPAPAAAANAALARTEPGEAARPAAVQPRAETGKAVPAAAVQPRLETGEAAAEAARAGAVAGAGNVPAPKRRRKRSRRKAAPERKPQASAAENAPRPAHRAEQAPPAQRPRWPKPAPGDVSALVPSRQGMILMRGHSDKGRRWHQEIELDLAVTLVREEAAVVVGRRTIRRLYSNKDFRRLILTRDNYTCYFCGLYGDTIDHLLPRAKGGHTTPLNCVCACNLCNQAKADQSVDEFMGK